jgi:hypothetical protein
VNASQPGIRAVLNYLTDALGPSLIGAACGLEGAAPLKTWTVRPPNVETEAKLRACYQVTRLLADNEGVDIARAWLIDMNPQLADENPLAEIGKSNAEAVLLAARSYLEDPMLT